ncbi:HAD-IA family hydrolase [soil metagenome]
MKSTAGYGAPQEKCRSSVPWRVVVFDLDDTLYPEAEFVRSGFRAVAVWSQRHLNCDAESTFRELMHLFDDGVRGTIFDSWVATHRLPSETIPQLVQVYREHYPRIHPFPGVPEMICELRNDFRLGLLSDGILAVQERKLSALGIGCQFSAVVFTDRFGREYWKPSVKPFLELMKVLKVNPEETVYVADNPAKDFIACRLLGMHSIWLRQSTGVYSALDPAPDACPSYVVNSIAAVRRLLVSGN